MEQKRSASAIMSFISSVRMLYPELVVEFDYDAIEDHYEIWHNGPSLQFENNEFLSVIGSLTRDLYHQDIFNFDFGYDHTKAAFCENKKQKLVGC